MRFPVETGYVPRVVRFLRRSMRRVAPPVLAALLPPLSALGGETASALPPDDVLESRGARIGAIEIEAKDIFDPTVPGEDNKLFRAADALHP